MGATDSKTRQLELAVATPATARPATRPAPPSSQGLDGPNADAPADPRDFGARVRQLLGHEPTGPELAEFVRVRDALDLRDNDALWLVLLALQHQRRAFEQAIEGQRRTFEQAIARRLEEARQTTDALIESARARFLAQFPAALKQAARRVSIKALGFNGPVVLSGPVAGVALALAGLGAVGAGWLAYELGERSGYERGMLTARTDAAPNPKPAAPAAH